MRKLTFSLVFIAITQSANAQQSTTTGSEPPAARKAAPAASAAAPTAPVATSGYPSGDPRRTQDQLDAKISELSKRFNSLEGRIGLGKDVLEKWSGIAQKNSEYGAAVRNSWAQCDLSKEKVARGKEKGYSNATLAELISEAKECDAEVSRTQSVLKIYANQLAVIEREIKTIELEVTDLGNSAENVAKNRKVLELEKALGSSVDQVTSTQQRFNPDKKRVTN